MIHDNPVRPGPGTDEGAREKKTSWQAKHRQKNPENKGETKRLVTQTRPHSPPKDTANATT